MVNNIIKLSILSQVRSLDPRISNEYPSVHVINMLYEGLMRLGPDGEIIPGVAESVTISEDKKTYTFHIGGTEYLHQVQSGYEPLQF